MHYTVNVDQLQPSLIPLSQSRVPCPQFIGATHYCNNGSLNYNALTLEGQRKLVQFISIEGVVRGSSILRTASKLYRIGR